MTSERSCWTLPATRNRQGDRSFHSSLAHRTCADRARLGLPPDALATVQEGVTFRPARGGQYSAGADKATVEAQLWRRCQRGRFGHIPAATLRRSAGTEVLLTPGSLPGRGAGVPERARCECRAVTARALMAPKSMPYAEGAIEEAENPALVLGWQGGDAAGMAGALDLPERCGGAASVAVDAVERLVAVSLHAADDRTGRGASRGMRSARSGGACGWRGPRRPPSPS
jgi:hypothetical protein